VRVYIDYGLSNLLSGWAGAMPRTIRSIARSISALDEWKGRSLAAIEVLKTNEGRV
jgi:hypothetical protein